MGNKKPVALLTSCSVTRSFDPIVKIADAPVCATMDVLCEWWSEQIEAVPDVKLRTPGEIYAGESFTAITEIAQDVGHDNVFIITGGVGLVRHTDKIAPYDFTADRKALANVHQKVSGEKFLPHVWWGKINTTLQAQEAPIRDLLEEYEIIVGALPKMFTKYILDDLVACGPEARRNRIFIPITTSMYGSMPSIVRDAYVPYTTEYLADIKYNRADKTQRVVQKFLREASNLDVKELSQMMIDTAATSSPAIKGPTDYTRMFEDHPTILEADDVYTAEYRTKILGYKLGGRARFAGAWRSAKGQIEVTTNKTDLKRGANVLQGIIDSTERLSDDDMILERLGAFVAAVREVDPHLVFMASEIVQWAKEMYPQDLRGMDNANKVSYLLAYNAGYLGVVELQVGSRKGFKCKD